MSVDYLLHESSVGYGIFAVRMQADEIGSRLKEVQAAHGNLAKFGKMVQLVSFAPFKGASQALENANDVSEGILNDYLRTILEANLPKTGKKEKKKIVLAVSDKNLAGSIKAAFPGVDCETPDTSEVAADMLRGLREHAEKLLKGLQDEDVSRAQLGLGHAYSRAKVKFSVTKNDNHIIQAIATLDHLDKAVNTFAMRVREWYGWHFPELVKIVSDNGRYARCALLIQDKASLNEDSIDDLVAIVEDESIARAIVDAAAISMGQDVSENDMENIMTFAKRAVALADYRKHLAGYLSDKMGVVAPNLAALIGETVGARLISKAGSLTNLAKYPASTVQILGAEKALFRALKTKGNTPKYGLIYNSSFIGRAGLKNKGRISRFLANKTSIASRIDNFSMAPTRKFGEALKEQVEERLRFYSEGINPTKNEVAMQAAMKASLVGTDLADPTATGGAFAEDEVAAPGVTNAGTEHAMREKKDKKKKAKRESGVSAMDVEMADADDLDEAVAKAERKAEKKRLKAEKEAADAEALRKQLKKEKKEKRKSEGGADEAEKKSKKKHSAD